MRRVRDAVAVDCLRAERACYRARQGHLDESEQAIRALRARHDARPIDFVTAWINLAEGLLHHSRDMDTRHAREKIHRAYALSEVSQHQDLIARTSAWLAHMDYLRGDVDSMVRNLRRSFQVAGPENHAALSRSYLVVADALHFAGRLQLAQPWYSKSRVHATAEGDEATISALMHNMAWLRAANLRQIKFCDLEPSPSGDLALLSADSIFNFDQLIGTSNLKSLVPILRAQILSVLGDHAQALALYEGNLAAALREGLERMHSSLLADQAWCRLQLRQDDAALRDAVVAQGMLDPRGHHDDRANAHSRLEQVFREVGEMSAAHTHATQAAEAWKQHVDLQQCYAVQVGELAEALQRSPPTK